MRTELIHWTYKDDGEIHFEVNGVTDVVTNAAVKMKTWYALRGLDEWHEVEPELEKVSMYFSETKGKGLEKPRKVQTSIIKNELQKLYD